MPTFSNQLESFMSVTLNCAVLSSFDFQKGVGASSALLVKQLTCPVGQIASRFTDVIVELSRSVGSEPILLRCVPRSDCLAHKMRL